MVRTGDKPWVYIASSPVGTRNTRQRPGCGPRLGQIRAGSDPPPTRINRMPLAGIALVAQTSDPNPNLQRGRRGNLTIPVLVEEAEGLLELGDLVVGELIRHEPGGGGGIEAGQGARD